MSTSTLYAVFRTTTTELKEYRNGWGTGPNIWGYLLEKFLGREPYAWMGDATALWDLALDQSVPLPLRACLVLTFDYAIVPCTHAAEMGGLVANGGEVLRAWAPERVNHFPAIGADLQSTKLDPRALGFGLSCTSVSDIWADCEPRRQKTFDCFAYIVGGGQEDEPGCGS